MNANVTEILIEGGRAVGVKVSKGTQTFEVRAPIVVSSAGLYNTFQKLLPPEIAGRSYYHKLADRLKPGVAAMNVFIGLNASNEELGLKVKCLDFSWPIRHF